VGQRILTEGRIAILSPLAAVNGFVRPWPPSNTWFLGPTRVRPQKVSRSVQPFLHGSWTWLTDTHIYTHTDRPCYSICSNRPSKKWKLW